MKSVKLSKIIRAFEKEWSNKSKGRKCFFFLQKNLESTSSFFHSNIILYRGDNTCLYSTETWYCYLTWYFTYVGMEYQHRSFVPTWLFRIPGACHAALSRCLLTMSNITVTTITLCVGRTLKLSLQIIKGFLQTMIDRCRLGVWICIQYK